GVIGRRQWNRMAAGVDYEVWCVGVAGDVDAIEHATEVARSRQFAADPIEHTEIRLIEREVTGEWGASRLFCLPRTERTLGLDLAWRHGIGQRALERHAGRETNVLNMQPMKGPDARRLRWIAAQNDELGIRRIEVVDDHLPQVSRWRRPASAGSG